MVEPSHPLAMEIKLTHCCLLTLCPFCRNPVPSRNSFRRSRQLDSLAHHGTDGLPG